MMRKMTHVARGMTDLVVENRAYFLAPILIALVFLSALCYYVGPKIIITFIYAEV